MRLQPGVEFHGVSVATQLPLVLVFELRVAFVALFQVGKVGARVGALLAGHVLGSLLSELGTVAGTAQDSDLQAPPEIWTMPIKS